MRTMFTKTLSAGGFFCQACLVDKPVEEQSPDDRYCQGCYKFLLKEAELDTSRRNAEWVPRVGSEGLGEPVGCNKIPDYDNHRAGRPHADIPVQKVLRLASQGMSLRGIAGELKTSHMTIARILKDKQ